METIKEYAYAALFGITLAVPFIVEIVKGLV